MSRGSVSRVSKRYYYILCANDILVLLLVPLSGLPLKHNRLVEGDCYPPTFQPSPLLSREMLVGRDLVRSLYSELYAHC